MLVAVAFSSKIATLVRKNDLPGLSNLMHSVVKRNHLGIDDISLLTTRSIADIGRSGLHCTAREIIDEFQAQVRVGVKVGAYD